MPHFAVTPDELAGAAQVLQSVDGALRQMGSGVGDLGSAELTGALERFGDRSDRVSLALAEAVLAAAVNVAAGGHAYATTDESAMPGSSGG
jgi:hypothetical protein